MPRRRMIGPEFWDDELIGNLTDTQRLVIIGCIGNADDEGRLKGSGAYLKASIFMYDPDKTAEVCSNMKEELIQVMQSWPANHPYRIISYSNGNAEYLFIPNFFQSNKPSHPTPSKLPSPPPEILQKPSGISPESIENVSGDSPSQVRSGQVSLGKVRLGKDRAVQENFSKFLDNETDLTDRLTKTLEECMPAEPTQAMTVIKQFWRQVANTELDTMSFGVIWDNLKKCPLSLFATCLVKSAKYSTGKRKTSNYIQAVFDEKIADYKKEHPP
jgi:hypothetical protein